MSLRSHQTHSLSSAREVRATVAEVPGEPAVAGSVPPVPRRAVSLIRAGEYRRAVELLNTADRTPQVRNALGVCLMRAGETERAVELFRTFVLIPGSTDERFELSDAYRRNFATALLLKGRPAGALAVLAECRDHHHPRAVQIRGAIAAWVRSLPFWRRIDWKLSRVEPAKCQIPLDFEAGEFDFLIADSQPVQPVPSNDRTAA